MVAPGAARRLTAWRSASGKAAAHSLSPQALNGAQVYERATKGVTKELRLSVYDIYVAKASEFFGIGKVRVCCGVCTVWGRGAARALDAAGSSAPGAAD